MSDEQNGGSPESDATPRRRLMPRLVTFAAMLIGGALATFALPKTVMTINGEAVTLPPSGATAWTSLLLFAVFAFAATVLPHFILPHLSASGENK